MNFQYINAHKDLFSAVLGMPASEFMDLLYRFSRELHIQERSWYMKLGRNRKQGGGRKPVLDSDAKKLFFVLFYYKTHPTYRVCQALFRLDKKNCRIWRVRLEKVLHAVSTIHLLLPRVKMCVADSYLWVIPHLREFIVDGTERPVKRSVITTDQEQFYSGKKKDHTVKNVICIDPHTKAITGMTDTYLGKTHDLEVFRTDSLFYQIPKRSVGLADSGFQGVDHPFLKAVIPYKRVRGQGELTSEQKATNASISKRRVSVEHVFAHLKKYKILSEPLREKLLTPDNLTPAHIPFETIAGLYNFHLSYVKQHKRA